MIICQIRKRVNGPKSELYRGVVAVACPNTLESIPALRPSGTGSTDTGNYQWCSESKPSLKIKTAKRHLLELSLPI